MQKSKQDLASEIAKIVADKAEKAPEIQSDLEWWSVLLESFFGLGITQPPLKPTRLTR